MFNSTIILKPRSTRVQEYFKCQSPYQLLQGYNHIEVSKVYNWTTHIHPENEVFSLILSVRKNILNHDESGIYYGEGRW